MSQRSSLSRHVHDRFREVFGDPNNSLGRDDHWSLQPATDKHWIHVLVNGTLEVPAVWVFDPHGQGDDGVMRVAIKDESHVDDVIKRIQNRMKRAAK